MIKKILTLLLVSLIIIQFFRPSKNRSLAAQPHALGNKYCIPAEVDSILRKTCYNCHSNNSQYPWYFNVQPSAWFLANHIRDGKSELNFDEFLTYDLKKQDHKLEELIEEVEHEEMPLKSYTIIHADAKLNEAQKAALIGWAKELRTNLK